MRLPRWLRVEYSQRMKKRPLFTIFLVVFFDLLSFGIVIPILPYYSKTFGASAFQLGWLMAAYSIAQFVCSPLWGSLSDRVGRRPVLLVTILLGASAMVATALAPTYGFLLAARFIAGAFAANISTANAYIADVTTEENRAKGMGVIGAGFGLGFIFGPAIGGLLAASGNFALPILCAAALGFLNFLFAFAVLEEPARNKAPASRSRWTGLSDSFGKFRTGLPIGLFFLHTLAFTQLEVAFALFVLARFGYGPRGAGGFLAGMGVISAVLQGGLIGRLAKKYGEAGLLPVAFFLLMIGMAAAAFAGTPTLFALALLPVAAGMGIANPCLSSLTSKGAAVSKRGAVLGIYQSAGSLARIVGPPVAGFLFDGVGPQAPLLCSSGLVGLGLAVALTTRHRLK
jgi:DHA1 family tetracycline resistance protein-like MFS transporter